MVYDAGTFVDVFRDRVSKSGHSVALKHKKDDHWVAISWNQWSDLSRAVAVGLIGHGVEAGARVCLQASTCWQWVIADIGILFSGAITVPIYHSNTPEQCAYIINDSGASVVFVDTREQLDKLLEVKDTLPNVELVVTFDVLDDLPEQASDWVVSLEQLIEAGRSNANGSEAVSKRIDTLNSESICTIVYTSGTTGNPKGVVLTHGNFAFECDALVDLGLGPNDEQLLFLPLAHIFAKLLYMTFIKVGGRSVFAESIEKVVDNMKEVKPTIVGSVPRIYEKVHTKVVSGAQQAGGLKQKIFKWACDVGEEMCALNENGHSAGPVLTVKHNAAMKLVGQKLHDAFGGRIRFFVSGGAPLSPEISRFFYGFGLEILEGYGLTETTAATHVNRFGRLRFGTVGTALNGVEVRIADDGEILVRGGNVMKGYYNKPEATAEVLEDDGWFHTGDIGEIDADGYLKITDRKKDIIVTAGGKNIAPQNIENSLKTNPYISQVMVHGDKRKFLSALITLDPDNVTAWAKDKGLTSTDYASLTREPAVFELVDGIVKGKNAELPSYETIKKFAILDSDFSQETGELTPTLKVRRKAVTAKHQSLLDSFYTEQY